jgi:hypothetical protein
MPRRAEKRAQASAIRIKSVSKFVEVVCQLRDDWIIGTDYFDPWFRGQRDIRWPLEPNIFRLGLLSAEDEMRAEFARKAAQFMTEPPPKDHWGWYFLMQHYGVPTRLLDWTDSALVALFFALNSDSKVPDDSVDGVVWMLDPWWLNRKVLDHGVVLLPEFHHAERYLQVPYHSTDSSGQTQIEPSPPAAIDPPYLARRVAVQRSHFTIFGNDRNGLTELANSSDSRLIRIAIAREKKERMRVDLLTLGISDTTIYPDLRGLSDELTRYHLGAWPLD